MSQIPVVLVVEDDPNSKDLIEKILVHLGYRVVAVDNGQRCLEMLETMIPDLVVMDLSMPFLDGWQTTRIIKSRPELRNVPVVAVSAHAMPEEKNRAIECGCDGYLSKPYRPAELAAAIKSLLPGR